ncbi:hypothetical protein H6F77_16925 [Microcoleus sp. FACHB-831]|nr:hypothetical protein [Microcoleus sp. FACHB-831]MBD1922739.1 hypothetical protein [Microcoleus sp. FACHB-831]
MALAIKPHTTFTQQFSRERWPSLQTIAGFRSSKGGDRGIFRFFIAAVW